MLCLWLSVKDTASCLPASRNEVAGPNRMLVDGPVAPATVSESAAVMEMLSSPKP